jgi:hypothetical protein
MKFIASIFLFATLQVISSKLSKKGPWCGPQSNLACVDQAALANSNSFALNVGCGNANSNSVAVANNNNEINQINKGCCGCEKDGCDWKKDKCKCKKDKCDWKKRGCC